MLRTSGGPRPGHGRTVEVFFEMGPMRFALDLPTRSNRDGDVEVEMRPEGLPVGRYTIAVYDSVSPDYREPVLEYRVEVE